MPITREQASALAELLCIIQPKWNTRGVIVSGLGPLAKHPAPLEVIAWAAIRAAQDRDNLTPAVIPLNGPHWNLADRPPAPRLTPDLECPQHVGQWAGNCPLCASERIARDDPTEELGHIDRATAVAGARAALAHARADTTDARPRPEPDPPAYGTPEHARAHHEAHPDRTGKTPDDRRRLAQRDARPLPEKHCRLHGTQQEHGPHETGKAPNNGRCPGWDPVASAHDEETP